MGGFVLLAAEHVDVTGEIQEMQVGEQIEKLFRRSEYRGIFKIHTGKKGEVNLNSQEMAG